MSKSKNQGAVFYEKSKFLWS